MNVVSLRRRTSLDDPVQRTFRVERVFRAMSSVLLRVCSLRTHEICLVAKLCLVNETKEKSRSAKIDHRFTYEFETLVEKDKTSCRILYVIETSQRTSSWPIIFR